MISTTINIGFFKSRIFPVLLVNFLGALGYGIVIPILIFIVIKMGGNAFVFGILGSVYPLFQFFGSPILGRLSDKIGRKKVFIITQIGSLICWSLIVVAFLIPTVNLWSQDSSVTGAYTMTLGLLLVFIARILDGFTGGNISVANAYLSDISTDEDRSANFGKMASAASVGFIIGPAAAGFLASTALEEMLPVIVAGIVAFISIIVINRKLVESNPDIVDTAGFSLKTIKTFFQTEHKDCYSNKEKNQSIEDSVSFSSLLRLEGIPVLFSVYFLTFLAFSFFYTGLPIYANGTLNWSPSELGLLYTYLSFVMIIAQGPILSYINKRLSDNYILVIGSVLLASGFIVVNTSSIIMLVLGITLISLGNGLMWPTFMADLSKVGTKNLKGAIQGYGTSMGSIAQTLGLIFGGILFQYIDSGLFIISGVIFVVITIVLVVKNKAQTP